MLPEQLAQWDRRVRKGFRVRRVIRVIPVRPEPQVLPDQWVLWE